jgi:hypothetical protein
VRSEQIQQYSVCVEEYRESVFVSRQLHGITEYPLPYHPPYPVPQAPPTRASDPPTPLRPCVTASASVTYATWSSLRPGSEVLSSSSKVRLCVVWCCVPICLSEGFLSVCSMSVCVCVRFPIVKTFFLFQSSYCT